MQILCADSTFTRTQLKHIIFMSYRILGYSMHIWNCISCYEKRWIVIIDLASAFPDAFLVVLPTELLHTLFSICVAIWLLFFILHKISSWHEQILGSLFKYFLTIHHSKISFCQGIHQNQICSIVDEFSINRFCRFWGTIQSI